MNVASLHHAEDFNTAVHAHEWVLADFWANWCGPCRALAPTLEKVAGNQAAWLHVAKINVDECPDLAARFAIRSIPSLLLFHRGVLVDTVMGAQPQPILENWLLSRRKAAA